MVGLERRLEEGKKVTQSTDFPENNDGRLPESLPTEDLHRDVCDLSRIARGKQTCDPWNYQAWILRNVTGDKSPSGCKMGRFH